MNGKELEKAIRFARENIAKGAAFIDGGAFIEEYFEALKKTKENS